MLEVNNSLKKGKGLGEKKTNQYIVEREFLGKFSAEELVIRIVKNHIKESEKKG